MEELFSSKISLGKTNMRPPEKLRKKCLCDIVATSAKHPNVCMTCDGAC